MSQLKFFLSLIFLFYLQSLFSQNFETEKKVFKGNVAKIYVVAYNIKAEDDTWIYPNKEALGFLEEAYFDSGEVRKVRKCGKQGRELYSFEFEKQKNGELSQVIGSVRHQFKYKDNLLTSIIKNRTRTQGYQYDYAYDRDGTLTGIKLTATRNAGVTTVDYTIEDGKVMESVITTTTGEVQDKQIYTYEDNLLQKVESRDSEGNLEIKFSYEYNLDEKGNWTHQLIHDKATGKYSLNIREIVYKEEYKTGVPKLKQLEGAWESLLGDKRWLYLKNSNKAKLLEKKKEGREWWYGYGDSYSYNSLSGEMLLDGGENELFEKEKFLEFRMDGNLLIMMERSQNYTNDKKYTILKKSSFETFGMNPKLKLELSGLTHFSENGLRGIKKANGDILIPAKYKDVEMASENAFVVRNNDGKYGILDAQANEIEPLVYDYSGIGGKGFIYLNREEKTSIYYPDGKLLLAPKYKRATIRKDGLIQVGDKKRQGLLDMEGNIVIPVVYGTNIPEKAKFNRIALYRYGAGVWDWYDGNFNLIRSYVNEDIRSIEGINPDCFKLTKNKKWKFSYNLIDKNGDELMTEDVSFLEVINSNLIILGNDKGKAFADGSGKLTTGYDYDKIWTGSMGKGTLFSLLTFQIMQVNAVALYCNGYEFGYLDATGKVIEPKYIGGIMERGRRYERDGFSFKYARFWKENETIDRLVQIEYDKYFSFIEPRLKEHPKGIKGWKKENEGENLASFEKTIIANKEVWVRNKKREKYNPNTIREILIPHPKDKKKFLQIEIVHTPEYYGLIAQDIYNLIHTIEFE